MNTLYPSFVLAGPGKSGSSALHNYLCQHPQIYMAQHKEPLYFAFPGKRPDYKGPHDEELFNRNVLYELNQYQALFEKGVDYKARGESSLYVHFADSAVTIADSVPDMKLIFILRNPLERVYSLYSHMARDGHEDLSFREALQAEAARVESGWSPPYRYVRSGLIAESLRKFYDLFPREQIFVIKYEDFKSNNDSALKAICDFLDVDDSFQFFHVGSNRGGIPKSRILHHLLYRTAGQKTLLKQLIKPLLSERGRVWLREQVDKAIRSNLKQVSLSVEQYNELLPRFEKDIRITAELTGLDLSAWVERSG